MAESVLLPEAHRCLLRGAICARSWSSKLEQTAVFSQNFRFFTYGNFPLEEHLKQIHEEALSKFQKIEPNTAVPPQQRWEKPVSARPEGCSEVLACLSHMGRGH